MMNYLKFASRTFQNYGNSCHVQSASFLPASQHMLLQLRVSALLLQHISCADSGLPQHSLCWGVSARNHKIDLNHRKSTKELAGAENPIIYTYIRVYVYAYIS